ncbi:hypothetical protein GV789_19565, partial [Nocardia cyriacigeorgica]|nr:hypothetical protein [Nocardia cyriacigeorgica]
ELSVLAKGGSGQQNVGEGTRGGFGGVTTGTISVEPHELLTASPATAVTGAPTVFPTLT